MDFKNFKKTFSGSIQDANDNTLSHSVSLLLTKSTGAKDFISNFGGVSFNKGIYRVHYSSNIPKWTEIVTDAFPAYKNKILVFGYDWLGRQFSIDFTRLKSQEPMILIFECGTGKAFEVPCTFKEFHEQEIVDYYDDVLCSREYESICDELSFSILEYSKCIGFKVPLFLGGKDSNDNCEPTDMEVYWGICGQLINKTKKLPTGTNIKNISIDD